MMVASGKTISDPRKCSISIPTSVTSKRLTRARSKSIIHVSAKYESLDYDIWENEILREEERSRGYSYIICLNLLRWILYLLIGLLTGTVAILIDVSIQELSQQKFKFLKYYLDTYYNGDYWYIGYAMWYLVTTVTVLIGSCLVIFIEPSAAGSGLPSVISHLNGVRIPRFTKLKVLIIKTLSVIFTCVAGLAAGKEGPFIHIGSIIGGLVTSIRFPSSLLSDKIQRLDIEREKRDLMAGGCAAGVSAAFGSPVGATLMGLEEGASFWSVQLMWRMFFCAVISCFVFNTLFSCVIGYSGQDAYVGLFYFGKFNETAIGYEYFELPLFAAVGAIGGLLGAAFVSLSTKMMIFRNRYVKRKSIQVLDAVLVSLLTTSFAIISINLSTSCKRSVLTEGSDTIQMDCEYEEYKEMSTFWFYTQESLLRLLFHSSLDVFSITTLTVYVVMYFVLLVITVGVNMSAGVFIPCLMLGATWGRIVGLILHTIFPQAAWAIPSKYALLGAAAQLGGVTRTTISLTVVIIEATGTLTFGLPLMLTLFVTKWIGDIFTEGIYQEQINLLGIPILPSEPPPFTSDIFAKDLMTSKVYAFPTIVNVMKLMEILQKVPHHGFPVVKEPILGTLSNDKKSYGELQGFILRSQLIELVTNKIFHLSAQDSDVRNILKRFKERKPSMFPEGMEMSEEQGTLKLDLRPYMNPAPYTIQGVMSFPRIFWLFRGLGLRHIIVVDNKNEVIGIITRKDLAKFRLYRHAAKVELKELRIH